MPSARPFSPHCLLGVPRSSPKTTSTTQQRPPNGLTSPISEEVSRSDEGSTPGQPKSDTRTPDQVRVYVSANPGLGCTYTRHLGRLCEVGLYDAAYQPVYVLAADVLVVHETAEEDRAHQLVDQDIKVGALS